MDGGGKKTVLHFYAYMVGKLIFAMLLWTLNSVVKLETQGVRVA